MHEDVSAEGDVVNFEVEEITVCEVFRVECVRNGRR